MKKASLRVADANIFPFAGEDPQVVALLRQVGRAFSRLQDKRHVADYDTATDWVQTEALSEVETAEKAFSAWQAIRHTKIARDYLVSLLIKPRG